jgi:hypothetical protein
MRTHRWPAWSVAAAGAVSGTYAAAGLFWAVGGPGFPFGAGDSQLEDNGDLLRDVTPGPGGAVMAALGAVGVVAASAMARGLRAPHPPPRAAHRVPLLAFGAAAAVGLALVLPEARTVKYLPPLGLLAFLRPPAWGTVNFLVLAAGGLAWAAATLAYARATSGMPERAGAWLDGHRHAVTWTAIVAPWVYAGYRACWALDVPIGVPQAFLDRINAANPGHQTRILELVLASFALGGSLLTWGLLRPWSRTFPRRLPGLGGRRVPPALPVAAAGLVAFDLTAFGISMLPGVVTFYAGDRVVEGFRMGLLYPLPALAILCWGVGLGLAAAAFARGPARRHGLAPGGPRRRSTPFVSTVT